MVLCMDEVQLSTGYRQKFLVFIWPNSGGGKAESTLWPLNGFEPWTPAECPSPPLPSQKKDGKKLTSKFEHRTMRIQYLNHQIENLFICNVSVGNQLLSYAKRKKIKVDKMNSQYTCT